MSSDHVDYELHCMNLSRLSGQCGMQMEMGADPLSHSSCSVELGIGILDSTTCSRCKMAVRLSGYQACQGANSPPLTWRTDNEPARQRPRFRENIWAKGP